MWRFKGTGDVALVHFTSSHLSARLHGNSLTGEAGSASACASESGGATTTATGKSPAGTGNSHAGVQASKGGGSSSSGVELLSTGTGALAHHHHHQQHHHHVQHVPMTLAGSKGMCIVPKEGEWARCLLPLPVTLLEARVAYQEEAIRREAMADIKWEV